MLKCNCLPTLYSDINISFLGTGAVLGLYGVDATVVPVSITDKKIAIANAGGNLNVNHGPLVNLFAILIPDNLGHRTSSDAAVELNVLSSPQGEHLVWRPLNLRSNWRCKENKQMRNQHNQRDVRNLVFLKSYQYIFFQFENTYCSHPWS